MKHNQLGFFALESLVTITEALKRLEIGQVCVAKISERLDLLHSFEDTITEDRMAFWVESFGFQFAGERSADTAMVRFLGDANSVLDRFEDEKKIVFIISDGRFNKKAVQAQLMEAEKKRNLIVFIVLDSGEEKTSILNMKSAEAIFNSSGEMDYEIKSYMEDFPFKYYTICQNVEHLPNILGGIFLQWLAIVNS